MLSRKKMWAALQDEKRHNESLTNEACFQLMRFYTKGVMDVAECKDQRMLVDHKGGMLIEVGGIYKIQPVKDRSILITDLPHEWRSYFIEKFMEGAKQLPDYASEWLKSVGHDRLGLDGDIRNLFNAIFNAPATCRVTREGDLFQIIPTTMALTGKTKRDFYIRIVKSDVHKWAVVVTKTEFSMTRQVIKLEKFTEAYKELFDTLDAIVGCTGGGIHTKPIDPSEHWLRAYNAFGLVPTDAMLKSERMYAQLERLQKAFAPQPPMTPRFGRIMEEVETARRVREEIERSDPNDPERPWLKRAQEEASRLSETKESLERLVKPSFTIEERKMSLWSKFKAFCILNPGVVALGFLAVGTIGLAAVGSAICTG
ncbi:hypothetical protein [Vibrio phage vB_VmeM-Yong XC32]|nr:hypothetical protein [Vibrio phage vB_VmeM-Yong XC31]QAX96408.1 hypothetical protein [Vibrio phage vB_VmeM-Yong XC32]QAX96725.1 hypothetical protein [Vibrio phage vB_VmeM-Yong MS31]QAX97044.1 hypothetical protein [Vibrio phage vB_VmeM-Yong MS32]